MFEKLKLMINRRSRVERIIDLLKIAEMFTSSDVGDTTEIIEEYDLSEDMVSIMWYAPMFGYSVTGYSFYDHRDIVALETELKALMDEGKK